MIQATRKPGASLDVASGRDRGDPFGRRTLLALFLVLFGTYGLATGGHVYSIDDELKYEATASLARLSPSVPHSFDVFPELYRQREDGSLATVYGIGQSVAALPFYVLGQALTSWGDGAAADVTVRMTTLLTNALLGAMLAVFLALLCWEMGATRRGALLLTIAFAVGTFAFPVIKTFGAEPGTALCLTACVWLAFKARRTNRLALFAWSGLAVGLAASFRVSALEFIPLVGLYVLISGRGRGIRDIVKAAASFTGGALLALLILGASNKWRYGSWFDIGYESVDTSYPPLRGGVNVLFSPGKSFFLFAPVAIVVAAGLIRAWRRADLRLALIGSIVAANVYTISRLNVWAGDHSWGPRYMMIVLPLFVATGALVVDSPRWRTAVQASAVVGFLFPAMLGVLVAFDVFFIDATAELGTDRVPSERLPMYLVKTHSDIRWNQMLGNAQLLPEAIGDLFDSDRGAYSTDPTTFYGYFGVDPRIDVWWLWVEPTGASHITYLLLLPTTGSVVGGLVLARSLRHRPVDAAAPTSRDETANGDCARQARC